MRIISGWTYADQGKRGDLRVRVNNEWFTRDIEAQGIKAPNTSPLHIVDLYRSNNDMSPIVVTELGAYARVEV